MVMVPIYAVSSFISLFSLEAAFFIDAVRDIYEVCCSSIFNDTSLITLYRLSSFIVSSICLWRT